MAPGTLLQRNIRPQATTDHLDDEVESSEEQSDVSSLPEHTHIDNRGSTRNGDGSDSEMEEDVEEDDDEDDVKQQINHVSFGALLEAQEALSRKRKRGSNTTGDNEAKLEGIRSRLREIRSQKESRRESGPHAARKKRLPTNNLEDESGSDLDSNSESDSAPSEEDIPTKSATSKHAPASQSSKRQVTRKRTVIDVPKRSYRDPRFSALGQTTTQPAHSEKAYSFLRDYQQDEIAELKAAVKHTRNEEDKATLTRKLVSMENRIKSKDAKDRAQGVLRQHRKDEREKAQQGKRPYFLKRSEVKERALVEKFKGMKSKEREKLMEKRKRKESQKEMKRMPNARRVAE